MTAAALLAALSLSSLNPAAHAGLLLGQDLPPPPPPPPVEPLTPQPPVPPPPVERVEPVAPVAPRTRLPAAERELTIKALREEVTELTEQKSSIGFFFPIFFIAAGTGLVVAGTLVHSDTTWVNPALLISGTSIAVLSTLWLIFRIVKSISLGGQISDKEEQLRTLEHQRMQLGFSVLPGGGLAFAFSVKL